MRMYVQQSRRFWYWYGSTDGKPLCTYLLVNSSTNLFLRYHRLLVKFLLLIGCVHLF